MELLKITGLKITLENSQNMRYNACIIVRNEYNNN